MTKTRSSHYKYANYVNLLDLDAFMAAIDFDPIREGTNKYGEPEDIGHCPDPWNLHKNGDTTGKFAINRERRLWNCFVCGGGSLLSLAMAILDMEDDEAELWLYQFATEAVKTDDDFLSEIDAILYQEKLTKPVMPWYNEHALDRWEDIGPIVGWLNDRGIDEDVAVKARVGYKAEAVRMAPIVDGKPSGEPYRGPCVYLPHFWGERLVGWQQRWLEDDRPKWVPKYDNTSNFPKTETIYGYEDIYLADRPIIVVESVPTALFLKSLGYPAVATFGGSVSDEQRRLLRLCQQGLVLAPDNDGPGWKWIIYTESEIVHRKLDRVLLGEYLARYVPVKVIDPIGEEDSGNDLGDLVAQGRPFAREAMKLLYDEARYY